MHMGSMGSSSVASMTMSMATSATSAMNMSMPTSSGMDMGMDMGMLHMHMYFTTQYKDYPVLFESLKASNKGQAFGIFLFLFVIAFLTRGLEFVRNYLEQVVWKNPNYIECHPSPAVPLPLETEVNSGGCCGTKNDTSDNSIAKNSSLSIRENQQIEELINKNGIPLASRLFRDLIRLILCILPDLFGFALMLAVMTFTLTYFFAVVLGLGLGRFFFERLTDHYCLKPVNLERLHC